MVDNAKKRGKSIEDIEEGDSLHLTDTIEDHDLLIYMGLTNDINPLYLDSQYASDTDYEFPLVPSTFLTTVITSALSKHLPGPGSHVVNLSANFILPVRHHETLTYDFEVIKVDKMKEVITVSVKASNVQQERVLDAVVLVKPPKLASINQDQPKEE